MQEHSLLFHTTNIRNTQSKKQKSKEQKSLLAKNLISPLMENSIKGTEIKPKNQPKFTFFNGNQQGLTR